MKSVLITGASTGIGRAAALHLDGKGWRVFAGVRREEDAASMREAGSGRLVPLMLDVTDARQIEAAARRIGAEVGEAGLDGLVNNAGIGVPGPLETLPVEDFRRQIEVNLTAHVAVTQVLLPAIRRVPGRIEVAVIEPGSIATPIWERGEAEVDAIAARARDGHADLYGETIEAYREVAMKTAARGIPPERVARTIERALTTRHPRTRYLVGADARAQAIAKRILPDRAIDWLVARATGM